jgi:hypothetical protein
MSLDIGVAGMRFGHAALVRGNFPHPRGIRTVRCGRSGGVPAHAYAS